MEDPKKTDDEETRTKKSSSRSRGRAKHEEAPEDPEPVFRRSYNILGGNLREYFDEQDKLDEQDACGDILANMYLQWTLDDIVELAHAVSNDIVDNPLEYAKIGGETGSILMLLRLALPLVASVDQRAKIYSPFLGSSDARFPRDQSSEFKRVCAMLRDAAAAYSEPATIMDFNKDGLKETFKDNVLIFREYVNSLCGTPIGLAYVQTKIVFDVASELLKEEELALLFTRNPIGNEEWPISPPDGKGATLVENMNARLNPPTTGTITSGQFMELQAIAFYGREAIMGAMADNWEEELEELIKSTYRWEKKLRNYQAS